MRTRFVASGIAATTLLLASCLAGKLKVDPSMDPDASAGSSSGGAAGAAGGGNAGVSGAGHAGAAGTSGTAGAAGAGGMAGTGGQGPEGGTGGQNPDGGNCPAGMGDCDGLSANGCETDLDTSITHCGSCNHPCSAVGGTPDCSGGLCSIACADPNVDCNKSPDDGCEVDVSADAHHCGDCDTICPAPAAAVATCAQKSCGWKCVVGSADCDGSTANGCESSVSADANNCGACGHKCIDTVCNNGLCQPVTIAFALNRPTAIVVDGTRVYWTDVFDGTLVAKPKSGGTKTTLADFGAGDDLAITSDLATVVWYTLVNVAKTPAAGGNVSVVTASGDLTALAVDADTVYFLKEGTFSPGYNKDGSVNKVFLTGGTVTPLATGQDWPVAVAVDGNNVYWIAQGTAPDLGKVMRMPKTGGTPVPIASDQPMPCGLAINPSFVFWMTHCDSNIPGTRSLMRTPKSGGSSSTLLSGVDGSSYLVADDNYVYWTFAGSNSPQKPGAVLKIPVTGGAAPIVLATDQTGPRGLTLDSLRIYWANAGTGDDLNPSGDGSVMMVAK